MDHDAASLLGPIPGIGGADTVTGEEIDSSRVLPISAAGPELNIASTGTVVEAESHWKKGNAPARGVLLTRSTSVVFVVIFVAATVAGEQILPEPLPEVRRIRF